MIIYRVRHPIVAARQTARRRVTTEVLPVGTRLELACEPRLSGVIQALWKGEVVRVFATDLLTRADPIRPKDL